MTSLSSPGHALSSWGISAIPNSSTLHTGLISGSIISDVSKARLSPHTCNLISQLSPQIHRIEKVSLTSLSLPNPLHFLHDHARPLLLPLASPCSQYRWWSGSISGSG